MKMCIYVCEDKCEGCEGDLTGHHGDNVFSDTL